MKLTKHPDNPILKPNKDNDWENLCVLNPAVWYENKTNTFYMLYRAAGDDAEHYIYLGLATSNDGINFTRMSNQPAISPTRNNCDEGGIEDPRIIKMDDWYYITYASRPYAPGRYWTNEPKPWFNPPKSGPQYLNKNSTLTHLAITKDFITYKKLGRITDSRIDDRDVIIFPEKINGKFVKLSRPMERYGKGYPCKMPSIWISYSDDLLEWDKPQFLMEGEAWWENKKIGGSCPPIKTKYGWFFIYHGVAKKDSAYRVGAVLLDLNNPMKIISRTKEHILEPEYDYETKGYYNGCVFPTANVVKEGTLYVYYGAADKYVCVATCNFDELLKFLINKNSI